MSATPQARDPGPTRRPASQGLLARTLRDNPTGYDTAFERLVDVANARLWDDRLRITTAATHPAHSLARPAKGPAMKQTDATSALLSTAGRLPRWALVVAPLVAAVVANADVAALLFADPQSWNGRLRLALAATLPLSTIASVWTLWLLVRSRRDMLRRDRAEAEMRLALDENHRVLRRELAVRRELDHRVRNNLAGLIGLIGLYERSGRPAAQLAHALRGKVLAMKEVHDIINRSGGAAVDLHGLLDHIADAIIPGPHRSTLHAHGPDVTLTTAEASATAMVLQELVTNSLKHGALAAPDGRVTVRWTAAAAEHGTALSLRWEEDPVPDRSASAAPKTGIGLPLIEGFVRSELHGDVTFGRERNEWTVDLRAALSCGPELHPQHAVPGQEILS